jgi:uncharacterized delta-60 repeat protein
MKKQIFWILAFGIVLGFGIWSLGFWLGGCAAKPLSSEAPQVLSVYPADGATGASLYLEIKAVFDLDMDPSTISPSTFTLVSSAGAISGTVSYDAANRTASFIPSDNLSFATNYTATISDLVKDANGNKINSPYSWSFTTGFYQTAEGTLDVSFSDGIHLGYGTYYEVSRGLISDVAQSSQGESMLLDSRGRILVAGQSRYQPNNSTEFLNNLAVWRIVPDGSLDRSFGSAGTFHSPFAGEEIGRSILIDPSGKILVTGDRYSLEADNNGLAIWRLTADGLADETFGTNGAVIYTPFDRGYSIALDPSGNIIVNAYSFGIRSSEGFKLLQFKADGTFDAVLSSTPEGVAFRTENTTTEASGKILQTGGSYLSRFNPGWTEDTSFGINGKVTLPGNSVDDEITGKSVLVDSFGRVVIMGGITSSGFFSGGKTMTIWRYK